MGYNISEVSGGFVGSGTLNIDTWTITVDLSDPSVTIVTGDFDEVSVLGGSSGEASDGYVFGPLNTGAYGSLTFDTTDGTFTFTIDRQAVIQSGSDQTVSFTVEGFDGGESDQDTVIIEILVCFARGTIISTKNGEQPVETLCLGDIILTTDDEEVPLRWIGMHRVSFKAAEEGEKFLPVRISAGALAPGRPSSDLLVSPQHRVLVDGPSVELLFGVPEILAPAIGLIAITGIRQETSLADLDYFHLLFDRHRVILTNDLPSESFYPGPWSFAAVGPRNAAEIIDRVPAARTPESYGPTARPAITVREARLLAVMGNVSARKTA